MKRIALFSICFVFFIFSVKPALSHSSAERTGVFFCTRDLHPEIYDQIGKKVTSSSIFTVASSSIYYSSPIPYRIARVGVGVGGGAAIAMFSYEAIYNLYKKGFPSVKESITSSTNSIGSMSGVKGNFVHVQDKNLNNKDVSTYRHCSILVAQYSLTDDDRYIKLGSHYTYGFFQDPNEESIGVSSGTRAIDSHDPLQESTLCTKIKDVDNSDYRSTTIEVGNFYYNSIKNGYNLLSNNCCTVAHNAVKHIGGDISAIDTSNFNHKVGIRVTGGLSFMVEAFGNIMSSSEKDTENEDL